MENRVVELEHAGWMARAGAYDGLFARITRQAIPALLDSLGELNGARLLDAACGTGHLAAAAAEQGACVVGVDFAAAMIERARANHPRLAFREGDLGALPFGDAQFDLVACAFGMHHLADPGAGLREVYRVLRPGGRLSFTIWAEPDQGHEFLGLVRAALAAHGDPARYPPGPPPLRFGSGDGAGQLMNGAGFDTFTTDILPLEWRAQRAEDALDMMYRSMVRLPMLIEAQEAGARERIEAEIIGRLRRYEDGDGIRVPFPALLIRALRPEEG